MEAYLDTERGKVLKASVTARVSGAENGASGEDGGYYIPKVLDGNLTWTPSKNNMPAVAPAYIKGDPGKDGKPGEKGDPGEPGKDGYTPIRGVDYWNAADKAEIKGYVDEAILGGAW